VRLHDHLDLWARQTPDAPFAHFQGRTVSYAEAHAEANRIAHALVAGGLQPGDRAAILAKNSPEFMLFYYGCSKAGIVPVPLNYRLAPPEWQYIVGDAGARLLVARAELVEAIEPVLAELKSVERCIALEAAPPSSWESWAGWLEGQPREAPFCPHDDGADVYQMYTSGTTGQPKGAVLTHRAVTSNVVQLSGLLRLESGDRYQIVAPVYHAAAAVAAFWAVAAGGCLYILEDFDPAEVARSLDQERIVATTLVPAMIQACLVFVPGIEKLEFEHLRFMVYGASPIAEETLRRAIQVFGCDFAQGYGMTETTAALTFLLPEDHERALQGRPELLLSAGRPLVGTDLRIVDEADNPVPNGSVGEIVARGPQLMRGYWNLEEATERTLAGGWMHTGDAGILDDDGYLYIQDRVKDMIVSGGENVYPREVEDVLFQHAAVADAAVIGVPSDSWGEEVKAIVVLREGHAATAEELIEHCRTRLGGFKRPRSVDFVAALPRNPSGKVLKKDLREPYWAGHSRRVS
jgi:acyl-CoA synthetase (AMP-forming)/AMP-acid ligase II